MDFKEKTINKELLCKNNFLIWNLLEVELPDGSRSKRNLIEHPGAAAILPILDDGKILLVKQYRKAIESETLEIPAGKLDKGENPEICAKRELEEETGYKAKNIEYLGKIATAPGFCNEIIHLYKATGLTKGKKHTDEDEFTENILVTMDELKKMIRSGEIIDCKTLSILAYL
ncbi:NUDIX hydrolase [Clostridium sp.]|uniref:NUDIX hydrolase n=1 Tax=Clostridium sp. TaxID=1506 RepID=UPI00399448AB